MQFEPGTLLLHYRLVEKLGEGGMGVVWRATDTTLDRDVAIKILPDVFANDPDRAARFEREAKVLASLNHTNITTVHSVHQVDGIRFLVMELAHGDDLSEHLARGPLPLDDTLKIARQIAEALEAAHESGVVHRDLKPANITVTADGRVELLDFGLAKALDAAAPGSASDLSKSPTLVSGHTAAGMILGTAAYMSPEQARGKSVDRRTDIWAFGCVLYEMLTRKKAFDGETVTDVLAAVVTRDADWSALPPNTPLRLRDMLRRCLEKDPQRRLRDAGEARIVIDDVIERPHEEPATPVPRAVPTRRPRLLWVVVGALTIAALSWLSARRHEANEPTHLSVMLPPDDIVDGGFENAVLAVARDGRTLAYSGRRGGVIKLYVRRFGDGQVEELAGTDGAHSPFFSPDGKWIAFFADGKLKKISVAGGAAFDMCDVSADRSGVWLDDGSIVFAPSGSSPLMRVSTAGGPVNAVTALDSTREERTHRWPDVLPGGEWVIFTVGSKKTPGDYEKSVIAAISMRTGERRDLYTGASTARYAAPGYLVLARNGVLLAAPLELDKPRLTGEPVPVTDGVAGERTSGANHFAVSRNGTLVFVPEEEGEDDVELAWVDRKGGVVVLDAPAKPYVMPNLSRDGRRVLVAVGSSYGAGDIWEYDMDRRTMTRLTFDGKNLVSMWTPDQRSVVYANESGQGKDGPFHISVKPLDGDVEGHAIFSAPRPMIIDDVTPDGRFVLFAWWGDSQSDIYMIPIDGSAEPVTVAAGTADQRIGSVSPDGRWLAYQSRETGTVDVYVRPFPSGEGKWQVSSGGGARPIWSPKGDELFWSWSGRMYGATVEARGRTINFGPPRSLFDLPPGRRSDSNLPIYDVAPDGSRFLVTRVAHPELSRRRIDVILNWSNQLRGLEKKGISQ